MALARRFSTTAARQPGASDYVLALGIAAVAVLCRAVLDAIAPGIAYLVVLPPAVVISGVFLGTLPGLVTAAAGLITIATLLDERPVLGGPPINALRLDCLAFIPACAAVLLATHALRRAAAGAAAAEARLAEVFRQIPGAAAILDAPDGRLLLRSSQSSAVLGQQEREVHSSDDLGKYGGLHPDGRPFASDEYPIVRALKTGEVVRGEYIRFRKPCGQVVDLEVHAGPVRGADGSILAAVGMAFDVSERVEVERRLRASEATYRATAERLGEQERALRAALESREIVMREADHRIKNSLQLVTSLLRLQLRHVDDPDARHALQAAIGRVAAVSDAHLALQHSPDLKSIAIDRTLQDLGERVGLLNPSVVVGCEAATGLWLDAEVAIPLGLIASELLTNALRHAFQPGASGEVTLSAVSAGGELRMIIADNGAGMPATPVQPGLGTSVMAALAKQIGATLVTQSELGLGTRVTLQVALPAKMEAGERPETEAA